MGRTLPAALTRDPPGAHPGGVNEEEIRHRQANWFLGGALLVICTGIGIAITMARADTLFVGIGFAVGVVLCWAVNKFVK